MPGSERETDCPQHIRIGARSGSPIGNPRPIQMAAVPLEDGKVTISRAAGSVTFPSEFRPSIGRFGCEFEVSGRGSHYAGTV